MGQFLLASKEYDNLGFRHLSWLYWHAVCAPMHIAPVHFGASIEALQKTYTETHEKFINTKLLDKDNWKKLKKELKNTLSELSTDEATTCILLNKLSEFNKPPQNIVVERLFAFLSLELGTVEKAAWKQRNLAGHGGEIKDGNCIQLITDVKLLKIRFHRMLLSMIGGNDNNLYYYDYYTIGDSNGYIKRKLTDPVP